MIRRNKIMSKELTIIKQQEVLGVDFQMYGTFEEPLFLAKDVADWIEHNNISLMLGKVDEDEKLMYAIHNSGQNRDMWFLTEDGLYEVLMLSRKPIAKEFKKEVKQLLKAYRLAKVSTQPIVPQTLPEALRAYADQVEKTEQLLIEQKQNQSKVDFFNAVTDSTDAIDMGSVAKVLNKGIGRNSLFALLRMKKVLKSDNQPYQTYIDREYFRVIETKFTKPNGDIGINLKTIVYQKGVAFISGIIDDYRMEKFKCIK
jgi:phage antirepressor YoqD-like protein